MSNVIKSLIEIKDKHASLLSFPPKRRSDKFESIFGEELFDILERKKQLLDQIVKEVFNDTIEKDAIYNIPDKYPEKTEILSKVGDYLNEKEALEVLEVEISKEDKFRRICEAALQDGVLSRDEENNINFEASILGIEKDKAISILLKVQDKMEIAKPKELVLEVLSNGQKKTLEDIVKEITSDKYSVKISKSEVFILLKEMNREVVFEDSTQKYFLISSLKTKQANFFQYRNTKYIYSLEDLPRNTPYVTFNSSPQKQECNIFINTNNKYFKNTPPNTVLRDVLFDAVAYHQMQKINTDSLLDPTRQLLKFKEDIGYRLASEIFEIPS